MSTPLTPAPALVPAPAPLDYGRPEHPPWWRWRFWRVPFACAAVAAAVYVISTWAVPTFERWQDLRRQKPLMAYRAPADQVVFDSAPGAAPATGGGPPAAALPALPSPWHSRPKGLAEWRVTNLAFLHARTSPGGNQRLVAVECLPDCQVVAAPVPGLTPDDRCLRFESFSFRPATWQQSATYAQSSMGGFRILTTGRRFRLFAGQPDPADASHAAALPRVRAGERPLAPGRRFYAARAGGPVPPREYTGFPPAGRSTLTSSRSA